MSVQSFYPSFNFNVSEHLSPALRELSPDGDSEINGCITYICGMANFAVKTILTPITMIADIVHGIYYAIQNSDHLSAPGISDNIKRLVVAYPLQQFALYLIPRIAFRVLGGPLTLLAWPLFERGPKWALSLIPDDVLPARFSLLRSPDRRGGGSGGSIPFLASSSRRPRSPTSVEIPADRDHYPSPPPSSTVGYRGGESPYLGGDVLRRGAGQ